jgi:hypothetical protein
MTERQRRGVIYLSHSSADKSFVKKIKEKLDPAAVFYDIDTVAAGQDSVEAMRAGVTSASVFVLFHSPSSRAGWVSFEKDLAELEKIRQPSMQVLVCPLDGESYRSLPEWMRRYMTTTSDFRVSDIVRAIYHLYELSMQKAGLVAASVYEGREDLERRIALDVMTAPAATAHPLNVVLLTGIQGMGRGTVGKHLIPRVFVGMRPGGPIFDLTDAADAIDWHLKLFEDLNGGITAYDMARQMDAFPAHNPGAQAEFLWQSLRHWGDLNQVVTVRSRWGLRDRGHDIKPWASELFKKLATDPRIKLVLISDRKLPVTKLHGFPNVRQYEVEELGSETIGYILSRAIPAKFLRPEKLGSIADRVHGHPATAHHVAFLVTGGMSLDTLSQFPQPIHTFQDKTLEAIYKGGLLTPLQGRIIRLLSWLPRLSTDVLGEVFQEVKLADLIQDLWVLSEYSLITQSEGGYYKVLAIVSSTFRRFTGPEDRELLDRIARILKRRFDTGQISIDLVDSLLIGIVSLEGGLPEPLRKIITPANLLAVVEEQYNLGMRGESSEAQPHFLLAHSLSQLALSMDCPDDTLENILFQGADSLVRTGQYPEKLMRVLFQKGFSSGHYIEGSYLFHIKRQYKDAAEQIELALTSGHFRRRGVRLLARIYLRLGPAYYERALNALSRIDERTLLRDTGLVVMKVRALKGLRRHEEARELQSKISVSDDIHGDLALYRAGQALRAGDLATATTNLIAAQGAPRSNKVTLKFLECAIAIEGRDFSHLPGACALAQAAGREPDALQLQARAAVVDGNWRDAEKYLSKIEQKDWFDLNVEIRMLELKRQDPEIRRDPAALAAVERRIEAVVRSAPNSVEGSRF